MEQHASDRALTITRGPASGGTVVIALTGELDAHTAAELEHALADIASTGTNVELDLTALSFLDSSGLAALLDGRARAEEAGASLRVIDTSDAAERLFAMTGVGPHLKGEGREGGGTV